MILAHCLFLVAFSLCFACSITVFLCNVDLRGVGLGQCYIILGGGSEVLLYNVIWGRGVKKSAFLCFICGRPLIMPNNNWTSIATNVVLVLLLILVVIKFAKIPKALPIRNRSGSN